MRPMSAMDQADRGVPPFVALAARQAWCKACRKQYDASYWRRTRTRRHGSFEGCVSAESRAWYRGLKERRPASIVADTSTTPRCNGITCRVRRSDWRWVRSSPGADVVQSMRSRSASSSVQTAMLCARTSRQRGVAQPGRAPRLGRGGRRFESDHPDCLHESLVLLAAPPRPLPDVAVRAQRARTAGTARSSPFAYDATAPLHYVDRGVVNHGYPIKVHDVSFTSAGRRVDGLLAVPPGKGPFPAVALPPRLRRRPERR